VGAVRFYSEHFSELFGLAVIDFRVHAAAQMVLEILFPERGACRRFSSDRTIREYACLLPV
jgi:hypothetical protein